MELPLGGFRKTHVLVLINSIFALLANLFSIVLLVSQKKIRTNKYYRAVLCLSIGDLIAAICGIHWFVQKTFVYSDDTSGTECVISFVALTASLLQTHFQMILLAAERFIASRGSNTSQRFCKLTVQISYMVISWMFCIAYMATDSLYYTLNGVVLCDQGRPGWIRDNNSNLALVIPIMLCLVIVSVLYILTIKNILRASKRVVDGMHNNTATKNRYVLIACIFT